MRRSRYLSAVALILGVLVFAPLSPAAAAPHSSTSSHSSTSQRYVRCVGPTETDNIDVAGANQPFADDMGNTWSVNYDITRDVNDNLPCSMRVVARIFDPAPDGTWSGKILVSAMKNAVDIPGSHGTHSGSSTYTTHFVWRGPWFTANTGSYHIQIDEYNGSTICIQCHRAMTNFNL